MIAIDLAIRNRKSLSAINSYHDNRFAITGSSHTSKTLNQLYELLRDNMIDLLFIDRDHTYGGVK